MSQPLNWDRAKQRDQLRVAPARMTKVGRAGDLPATPAQLAFLRVLHVEHGGGLTRLGAMTLIDRAKRKGTAA